MYTFSFYIIRHFIHNSLQILYILLFLKDVSNYILILYIYQLDICMFHYFFMHIFLTVLLFKDILRNLAETRQCLGTYIYYVRSLHN